MKYKNERKNRQQKKEHEIKRWGVDYLEGWGGAMMLEFKVDVYREATNFFGFVSSLSVVVVVVVDQPLVVVVVLVCFINYSK